MECSSDSQQYQSYKDDDDDGSHVGLWVVRVD